MLPSMSRGTERDSESTSRWASCQLEAPVTAWPTSNPVASVISRSAKRSRRYAKAASPATPAKDAFVADCTAYVQVSIICLTSPTAAPSCNRPSILTASGCQSAKSSTNSERVPALDRSGLSRKSASCSNSMTAFSFHTSTRDSGSSSRITAISSAVGASCSARISATPRILP